MRSLTCCLHADSTQLHALLIFLACFTSYTLVVLHRTRLHVCTMPLLLICHMHTVYWDDDYTIAQWLEHRWLQANVPGSNPGGDSQFFLQTFPVCLFPSNQLMHTVCVSSYPVPSPIRIFFCGKWMCAVKLGLTLTLLEVKKSA